jgi:hypothetical protein
MHASIPRRRLRAALALAAAAFAVACFAAQSASVYAQSAPAYGLLDHFDVCNANGEYVSINSIAVDPAGNIYAPGWLAQGRQTPRPQSAPRSHKSLPRPALGAGGAGLVSFGVKRERNSGRSVVQIRSGDVGRLVLAQEPAVFAADHILDGRDRALAQVVA